MKLLQLVQGSEEWLAHRRTTRNASDAPVMMGASPSISRRELVRLRATGLDREFSDYIQKHVLDKGHEVEPLLRAYAEKVIGEELYPVVATTDDGYLGASYDGLTIGDDWIFEAKQYSASKAQLMSQGQLPPADYWQIVQQFAVNEAAENCIYVMGDGSEDGTMHIVVPRAEVQGDIPKLLAGWRQFDADVAAYVPETAAAPAPVGRAPEALPALSVVARGVVEFSNHLEFKQRALAAIATVNRDLQSDDDFASAELTIKAFKDGEDRLEATRAQILGQMTDVNAVMQTIDDVSAELRRVRLDLSKLVTAEKENRKAEIVQAGARSVRAHYDTINATLGDHRIQPPQSLMLDLGAAIKGKRSLASMKDAVDAAVAAAKIAGSQQAERVRACVRVLEMEVGSFASLFPDRVQLCATKQPEDLRNLVAARIADHQQREAERLEREQARQEQAPEAQSQRTGAARAPAADPPPAVLDLPPDAAGKRIKLGDINGWIAPISITAAGLVQLGFKPVATQRAAQLYNASDLPAICRALMDVVAAAPARAQGKEAA